MNSVLLKNCLQEQCYKMGYSTFNTFPRVTKLGSTNQLIYGKENLSFSNFCQVSEELKPTRTYLQHKQLSLV